jgi:AhpD family alkylhydroperoxidase
LSKPCSGIRWNIGLPALRSVLKERALLTDLEGDSEYADHIRSRLIPRSGDVALGRRCHRKRRTLVFLLDAQISVPQVESHMTQRLDPLQAAPDAIEAVLALSNYVSHCGLEPQLLSLVKMRASQMNGCAFCLDMHSREARTRGETEQRLHLLDAWREAPLYTDRERAALAWTEALTLVAETHAPDDVYSELTQYFSDAEIVRLSTAIAAINAWNRLAIGFRVAPGSAIRMPQARSAA